MAISIDFRLPDYPITTINPITRDRSRVIFAIQIVSSVKSVVGLCREIRIYPRWSALKFLYSPCFRVSVVKVYLLFQMTRHVGDDAMTVIPYLVHLRFI